MKTTFTRCLFLLAFLLTAWTSKAAGYVLDGPSEITTQATWTVKTSTGGALPAGVTIQWTYSSEFYRVSETTNALTLGRRLAKGTFTIEARMSDGGYASKTVTAKEPDPFATTPTFHCQPEYVSNSWNGTFEDVLKYTVMTRTYFYAPGAKVILKCKLENLLSQTQSFDANLVKVAFKHGGQLYAATVRDASQNTFSSINVPAKGSVYIHIELPLSWPNYLQSVTIPDGTYRYLQTYFFKGGTIMEGTAYNYLFAIPTRSALEAAPADAQEASAVSVYPTQVTSGVTVKANEMPIRSVQVVNAMGGVVKSQSCNGATEAALDLSNCRSGWYYIRVAGANRVETVKIYKR